MAHLKDIGEKHWIGELYQCGGWRRYTLFHIVRNQEGGSISWPIAEIDIVDHPSSDTAKPHKEVRISIRNEVRQKNGAIQVDGNKSKLRHPGDVVEQSVLEESISVLRDLGAISLPFSVSTCMRHVEDFRVEGDYFDDHEDDDE